MRKCLLGLLLLSVCVSARADLTPEQHRRADRLVSVFENETLDPQYGYIENLHDGRGYTAGRIGFCTATADLLLVVENYTQAKPVNPLAKYLPRLRELARDFNDSVEGLDGFPEAWLEASHDPLFQKMQDDAVDLLYFAPSMDHVIELGLKFPLSAAAIYEAMIQHGDSDNPDSVGSIIQRATDQVGGTPKSGVIDEKIWLNAFLKERRKDLLHAYDPATRDEWRASVGRANAMLKILKSGNFALSGPISVNPYGTKFIVP